MNFQNIRSMKAARISQRVALRSSFCSGCISRRFLHARFSEPPIPSPTPFVPDVSTFLSLIGRGLSQYSSKIPNWQSLFTLTSTQLKLLGVEPPRTRRYLLWWRDRFRRGIFGIGGDLKYVKDGEAELRVVEVPASDAKPAAPKGVDPAAIPRPVKRFVINQPAGIEESQWKFKYPQSVKGMKIQGAGTIVGPFIRLLKGTRGCMAKIKVQEAMWEVKRGVKVDGGERRKVQVRRKRLLEERKTTRAK